MDKEDERQECLHHPELEEGEAVPAAELHHADVQVKEGRVVEDRIKRLGPAYGESRVETEELDDAERDLERFKQLRLR